ncbi:hypothetical protein A2U01_0096600, partial [Trifolium medium]|nr:hypothetical protein [Trifolium medium]
IKNRGGRWLPAVGEPPPTTAPATGPPPSVAGKSGFRRRPPPSHLSVKENFDTHPLTEF